jgi:hypothetical protein
MKSLALLIGLGLAGFFIYPLAMQRTASECRALSRSILPPADRPNGAETSLAARKAAIGALPGWPAPVGCAWLYWRAIFHPPA